MSNIEREHQRLNRALKMAVAANNALLRGKGELELFQEVCNIAVEIGGYRMAWIGYIEFDSAKTIRPVTQAGPDRGYLESAHLTWEDNERGHGPSGRAIRSGNFVISRNIATDPTFQPWRDQALERGFASCIALPIKIDGQVFGELAIYSSAEDAFDDTEVEILQGLVNNLGTGTALIRARIEAVNNEVLFRTIFERAPLGIIRFDSEWRYLSVNAAYAQMVGYSEAELLNMTIMDLTHPDDKQLTVNNKGRLDGGLSVLKDFEKRYVTKSGKEIWVRISGKKLKVAGHENVEVLATVEDITERREWEAKLELERRKVLQNAKLASLGEMSAGIAHEINNPLTIILGSLGLLARDRLIPENFDKTLLGVRKAAEKIAHTVNTLTRFSRRSEFSQKSPRVLAEIVKDVTEIMRTFAKRFGVQLELELQSNARILCNEIEIAQILQNLLSNGIDAVKASPEKWVRVKVLELGGKAVVQVSDSGPGVAAGSEEKIFEAFYTTKPIGSGTGLGLSIVKGLALEHEGTVKLLNLGGYTCFELRFAMAN